MAFIECKPTVALLPFVDAFWLVKQGAPKTARILPDGCQDVVVDTHNPALSQVIGTIPRFVDANYSTPTALFGIRFKPAALIHLIPIPQDLLYNQVVDLSAVCRPLARRIAQIEPLDPMSFSQWVAAVEPILLAQLSTPSPFVQRVTSAVEAILQAKGQIRVGSLTSQLCLSERQLERHFVQQVGMAPKRLIDLVRFRALTHLLQEHSHLSLAEIAFRAGYYDSAHLTRVCKQLAGQLPSQFEGRRMSAFYNSEG